MSASPVIVSRAVLKPYPVVVPYSNHQVICSPWGCTRPGSVAPVSVTDVAGPSVTAHPESSTSAARHDAIAAPPLPPVIAP